jgi:hypothetical protein
VLSGRGATVSVVVFSFPDEEAASLAAVRLVRRVQLQAGDVSRGTRAIMSEAHDDLPLLAAAMAPQSVDIAVAMLQEAGGTCLEVRN